MQPTISENEHPQPVRLSASHGSPRADRWKREVHAPSSASSGLSVDTRGVVFLAALFEPSWREARRRPSHPVARFRADPPARAAEIDFIEPPVTGARLPRPRPPSIDEPVSSTSSLIPARVTAAGPALDVCRPERQASRPGERPRPEVRSVRFSSPRLSSTSAARYGSRARPREPRSVAARSARPRSACLHAPAERPGSRVRSREPPPST